MTDYRKPVRPPMTGDETETMLGALDRARALVTWRCSGLDAEQMATTVGASTMTLAGLLKHVSAVETTHFHRRLLGEPAGARWVDADWDADPDWDWHSALDDSPEDLLELWRESVTRSRQVVADLLERGGLDHVGTPFEPGWPAMNLRRALADLVEEHARHAGHADLLREAVDGQVGEDAPDEFYV